MPNRPNLSKRRHHKLFANNVGFEPEKRVRLHCGHVTGSPPDVVQSRTRLLYRCPVCKQLTGALSNPEPSDAQIRCLEAIAASGKPWLKVGSRDTRRKIVDALVRRGLAQTMTLRPSQTTVVRPTQDGLQLLADRNNRTASEKAE